MGKAPLTGHKADTGKPRMTLLPLLALEQVQRVFVYGAQPHLHGENNWVSGIAFTRLMDANHRHITAFLHGEDLDPESGLHHLAHACCNTLMCLQMALLQEQYGECDDRVWPSVLKGDFSVLERFGKTGDTEQGSVKKFLRNIPFLKGICF